MRLNEEKNKNYHFFYKISLLISARFSHPNSFQSVICDHPSFLAHIKIGTHNLRKKNERKNEQCVSVYMEIGNTPDPHAYALEK